MGSTTCILMISIVLVIILLVTIILVVKFAISPRRHHRRIDVSVASASLTRFDLDRNNGTLMYALALGIRVRNPNKGSMVYYKKLDARALYDGVDLGTAEFPAFDQHPRTETMLSPSFQGQVQVPGDSVIGEFLQEKEKGSFSVDVKLHGDVVVDWVGKSDGHAYNGTTEYFPDVDCMLMLPFASGGGGASSVGFSTTVCNVKL